jgi:CRISPR-associated endonuclease/helicase Cas3
MNVYLDSTLRWMAAYRVPVILLSATLPPKRRAELVAAYLGKKPVIPTEYNTAYPLLTWTDGEEIHEASVDMKQAQKCIAVEQISESALPQVLGEKLSDGGCAAVIVNTVKFAQRLSEQLEQALPDCTVICFHSRFLATDRARIEQELLQRIGKNGTSQERSRVIVVGTQVLEQSLDLDFDYMVTELCPMDLLLQRSGRLHRHTRGRPAAVSKPVLAILQPDDEKMTSSSERIYGKWLLQQTERYLPDMLSIPSCIPVLVGEVYAGARTEEELADKAWVNYSSKMKEKRRKAQVFCIDAEDLDDPDECDTMLYFLDDETGDNEQKAIAAVRDTEETMEVLVMQEADAESLRLIAGKRAGQIIPATQTPTEEEALDIARERLRLPSSFSKSYQFDRTVSELRKMPQQWAKSKWLAGEMLLVFDKEYCTELAGCRLNYDRKRGLIEEWNENST